MIAFTSIQKINHCPSARFFRHSLLGLILLQSAFGPAAFAQPYTLARANADGGGGSSAGGKYALAGSIGQPESSSQPLAGGKYSVAGGFWNVIQAVQAAGAPPLNISRTANSATIFWKIVPGWNLQQNNNLATPAAWTAAIGNITQSQGTNYLIITPPTGNLFFRLKTP